MASLSRAYSLPASNRLMRGKVDRSLSTKSLNKKFVRDQQVQYDSFYCKLQQFQPELYIQVGLYGWRKKLAFFLLLIITILGIINAFISYFIITTFNVNWTGLGNIVINDDGVVINGKVFMKENLFVTNLQSPEEKELKFLNQLGYVFELENKNGKQINAKLNINSKNVSIISERISIGGIANKPLISIDDNQLTLQTDNLKLDNKYGLSLNSSLQSPLINGDSSSDLIIQSKTRQLKLIAPTSLQVRSGEDVHLNGRKSVNLFSKSGKVIINSHWIEIKNLKAATPFISSNIEDSGVYQVCVCSHSGRLFIASSKGPCSHDVSVCVV